LVTDEEGFKKFAKSTEVKKLAKIMLKSPSISHFLLVKKIIKA
jgi:hypothetical protein